MYYARERRYEKYCSKMPDIINDFKKKTGKSYKVRRKFSACFSSNVIIYSLQTVGRAGAGLPQRARMKNAHGQSDTRRDGQLRQPAR